MPDLFRDIITLVLPLFVAGYVARWHTTNGTRWEKGLTKNWVFPLFILGALCSDGYVIHLSHIQYDPQSLDTELTPLDRSEYEKELTSYDNKVGTAKLGSDKDNLMRIFDESTYAWSQHDYNRTITLLVDLNNGNDLQGSFAKVPSYTVDNNLGCAYFKTKRNKQFDACRAFFRAKDKATLDSETAVVETISHNIDSLDKMVNRLD